MDAKVCDFLREVDEYFNNGTVNVVKFKNFTKCHSYCPYKNHLKENRCTNNYERINALGSYLFNKIYEFNKTYEQKYGVSKHIELFMIWLGDKLFKIESDYGATLDESYKKYLMNYIGNNDYWNVLDSKKLYKNATIKKMSDLCGLLNSICKLINEYNKNTKKINRNQLRNTFAQCLNFYRSILNSVNGCKPYLHLLDNLKMMYENFRTIKMVNNNFKRIDKEFLNTQIKPITTFNNENKLFITLSESLSFDDKECRKVKSNDEQAGKNIQLKKSQGTALPKKTPTATQGQVPWKLPPGKPPTMSRSQPQPRPQPPLKSKPEAKQQTSQQQSSQQQSSQPPTPLPSQKKGQSSPITTVQQPPASSSQNDPSLQTSQARGTNSQSGTKDLGSNKGNKGDGGNAPGGGISQPGNSEGKPKDVAQKNPNQVDNSSPGSKAGGQGSSGSQTQHSGNPVPATDGADTSQSPDTIPPPQPAQPVQPPASSGPGTPSSGTATTTTSPTVKPGKTTTSSKDTQNGIINPQDNAQIGLNKIQDPKGGTSSQQTNQGDKQVNQNDAPVNPTVQGSSGGESKDNTQMKTNQVGDSSSTPQIPGPENKGTKQGASSGGIDTLKNPINGVGNTDSGSKTGPSTDVKNQHQNPDPNQGVSGGGSSGTGGGIGDTGGGGNGGNGGNGLGDQRKLPGGSSDPAPSTPGGSFDWGPSIFKFLLNGTENLNKASQVIQKNQQKVKEVTDKISNVYKNTMDNLKDAYNKSSSHLSEFINNVTSQLNQVGSPNSGGNQPGSGGPLGGGNSSNQSPSPQSPSATDPKNPPLTLPLPPLPNPSPILPLDPSKVPLQQKKPHSQSQPSTQQSVQVPVQVNQLNHKAIVQLAKSPSSNPILKKPWNIFPTTWNGLGNCKPEIKFMNTTLVCCTSEQCSLTGISVTLILIPIILSIAYKYLSFGSSKKSEKKNMKRVINFHDGNKKTKIIISSNDRNKNLKPVINSVDGKKNPLSNIYKLIQADPMPFINLFFLLIFFVYKRKRDSIE
ncbi:PIR protein CIR protein [Plasmodium vinckei brucechwatti]|uniref:PIR protein CIR protein n=1 Tax=Plasmodium vinckei brucechwatti TaxID=119398 RepID=A0A6V7T341_PLAVN|nr:PIR protein CIR protein [Plasmodium vinckei brucechwatti]